MVGSFRMELGREQLNLRALSGRGGIFVILPQLRRIAAFCAALRQVLVGVAVFEKRKQTNIFAFAVPRLGA
ncbi:hypothetical protein [Vannielia sp. SX4]|uniref:hypothetical protein n=1 Tax=Vannielia sp. SX4 TaxID=3463852 RepID=UPI004058FD78